MGKEIIEYYYHESGLIPNSYGDITLTPDDIDKEEFKKLNHVYENIIDFVEGGYNLLIHGSTTGNGKTSWACKLAYRYTYLGYFKDLYESTPVLYINFPEYMIKVKLAMSDKELSSEIVEINNKIEKAKLVIWDDFTYKTSEYGLNILYSSIDKRIANNLSNIFVSNLDNKDDYSKLGHKLISRIINTSDKIHIQGESHRYKRFFN